MDSRRRSILASVSGGTERLERRVLLAHDPVIELRFDEPEGSDTVTDSAAAGGVLTGTLTGNFPPEIRATDPSPAGGNYAHFDGNGQYLGSGGRVDMSALLNPVLGGTSSLGFYVRTDQVGDIATWKAPGVTGAEQQGGVDDIFWGNLDPQGRMRIQTGVSPISSSTPVNTGEWIQVTQTRDATTGRARTYVNGVFVSEALTDPGVRTANFRAIGATTDVAFNRTTVQGYNYLSGDLDQVEVFDRELTPQEVSSFYGAPAAVSPASPAPLTATADTATQVTLTFADVANENGYTVLRSGAAGGPFVAIGTTQPGQTTFRDRTVVANTQYFYQVVAFNRAGASAPAAASVTTPAPAVEPTIVYDFNENGGDHVEDVSVENSVVDGTLAGDVLPEYRTAGPSPAGGSYLHLEGDGIFKGTGGRVDADELLNPILGGTATLSYFIRTEQTGPAPLPFAPGVTGGNPADGSDNIFWGSLDPEGRARVQAGAGAASASTPVNTNEWVRVTHTRDAVTGVLKTYVNGALVSTADSGTGQLRAEFRAIGAVTDVAADETTIEGYNYLNGDLDQVEIFDRVVGPQEVARRYGIPAGAVPASPTPLTATANSPTQITLNFADVASESGYTILRSGSAAGPFVPLDTVGPDQSTYVDQGLTPSTPYFYQVVAFNQAGASAPASANTSTLAPVRNPVIVYNFDDAAAGTTVANSGTGGATYDGTLAGDLLPTFGNTNPSPAGGGYLHFAVAAPGPDPDFPTFANTGGRVDVGDVNDPNTLLNPILGGTSSLSFLIRTEQVGASATWQAPGVTGGEQAGGTDDIFWGNLDTQGRARIQTGLSPISASTPVNTGQWFRVTQTRNATAGRARTYVNGVLVSEATTDPGVRGANFRAIGATTDLANDKRTIQSYNYLDGDLDQVEIIDRELSPEEVAQFYAVAPTPEVTQVYLSGSAWTPAFKNYLAAKGLGSAQYGFAIPAADQLDERPWVNLNQVSITFNTNVQVDAADLAVRGVNVANYALDPAAFVYDAATKTATWRLAANAVFASDKIILDLNADGPDGVKAPSGAFLDGDWINPVGAAAGGDAYPSGDGSPGGDFRFRVNVLPGDTTRDGSVLADDFSAVKKKFFKDTADTTTGDTSYSPFHSVNGDGVILAVYFSEVKKRFFNTLPGPQPAAVAVATPRRPRLPRDAYVDLLTGP
jgi:hypothetical protein